MASTTIAIDDTPLDCMCVVSQPIDGTPTTRSIVQLLSLNDETVPTDKSLIQPTPSLYVSPLSTDESSGSDKLFECASTPSTSRGADRYHSLNTLAMQITQSPPEVVCENEKAV